MGSMATVMRSAWHAKQRGSVPLALLWFGISNRSLTWLLLLELNIAFFGDRGLTDAGLATASQPVVFSCQNACEKLRRPLALVIPEIFRSALQTGLAGLNHRRLLRAAGSLSRYNSGIARKVQRHDR
jgi:hypothetical protein